MVLGAKLAYVTGSSHVLTFLCLLSCEQGTDGQRELVKTRSQLNRTKVVLTTVCVRRHRMSHNVGDVRLTAGRMLRY